MDPQDVVSLIEGTPQISEVRVNPGETNVTEIIGDNVEWHFLLCKDDFGTIEQGVYYCQL